MYFFRLHAWGDTLEEAFEQCAMAMFGYMTDTGTVEPLQTVEVETEGNQCIHKKVLYKCAIFYIISVYFHNKNNKIDYEPVLPKKCIVLNSSKFLEMRLLNIILLWFFLMLCRR